MMKIREIKDMLDAEVLCCEELLDTEVYSACCSDMMSDVLAYVKDQGVLLTGLINPQVIRTAEMLDIRCLIFVRGKTPSEMVLDQARELGITVLTTKDSAFTSCGKLYAEGLRGVAIEWPESEGAT